MVGSCRGLKENLDELRIERVCYERVTSNSEVMQMLQTAAFARYALGRDSATICPYPLPPLRPERAASGVGGLRHGSGPAQANHALMSETAAGKPQPEAIPLNI
jgi:hypothetical protein